MALSGSFQNLCMSSNRCGLYCTWSATQSVTGNYSDVTVNTYIKIYDLYLGSRNLAVNINGSTENFTIAAISDSGTTLHNVLLNSRTVRVNHNSSGKATGITLSSTYTYNGTYSGVYYSSLTASTTIDLNNIDRTAPTVTISTSDITATSVKVSATASTTCDRWDYSIDNGSTWTNFSTTADTSASKNITGLTPNTTYNIKVRARKKTNQVYGTSSKSSPKTLGGSVIGSVSTFTADDATAKLTLSVTVYDTSYTHKLVIKNGTTAITTISSLTLANGSNTITLTAAQRSAILAAMASIKSFTGTFVLSTYSGSTQIGSDSSKTATVQTTSANSAPVFSGFTFADSNTTTTAVTGDNQKLIQGISTLKVTVSAATAKNGATISSYSAVAGSTTKASTATEFTVGAVNETGTVPIIVTAVDSRGYTSSATVNVTVIPYEKIDITTATMRRINEVEDITEVTISGDITPVTIGGENKNSLRYLYYRYKKTSDENYSGYSNLTSSTEYDDDSFIFTSEEWATLPLDSDYSYYVQFLVTDKLTSDSVTIAVPQGTPLLSFRRKKVGVNNRNPSGALDVVGSVVMNGFNVLGLVAALGDTEDLNNLTDGGIYTQALNANASTDRHYPKAIAGFLEVMVSPSGYILQRYTAYNNSAVYVRTRYDNTWYAWKSVTLTTV